MGSCEVEGICVMGLLLYGLNVYGVWVAWLPGKNGRKPPRNGAYGEFPLSVIPSFAAKTKQDKKD